MDAREARDSLRCLREQGSRIDPDLLDEVWNGLPVVHVDEILGSWKGTCFDTGHRGLRALQRINWYGHTFHSPQKAEPLVRRDPDGALYSDDELMFGEASLWMAEFRGQLTATMIYDGEPVLTHFKKIDDCSLLAIMNGKPVTLDQGRHLYYVLDRARQQRNDADHATPGSNCRPVSRVRSSPRRIGP